MTQYMFDNARPQTSRRFASLESLFDTWTMSHLERIGLNTGWHCLEVGGGGGSIAAWLSERVGHRGRVVVTDIDPRHLQAAAALERPNLEIQGHDIGADSLPEDAFDLVHERLVLNHVARPEEALQRMVAALKPGGWLVAEDFDAVLVERTSFMSDATTIELFRKLNAAQRQLLAAHGGDHTLGCRLPMLLQASGLANIAADGYVTVGPGGSAPTRLAAANFAQVREQLVGAGLTTATEVDMGLGFLDDPAIMFSTPILMTAWGRRPGMSQTAPETLRSC